MFGLIAVVTPTSDTCRWVCDAFNLNVVAFGVFEPRLYNSVHICSSFCGLTSGTFSCCTHPSFRDFQTPDHVQVVYFFPQRWRQHVTDQKLSANRWAEQTHTRHSCGYRSDEIVHKVTGNMQKYVDVEGRGQKELTSSFISELYILGWRTCHIGVISKKKKKTTTKENQKFLGCSSFNLTKFWLCG